MWYLSTLSTVVKGFIYIRTLYLWFCERFHVNRHLLKHLIVYQDLCIHRLIKDGIIICTVVGIVMSAPLFDITLHPCFDILIVNSSTSNVTSKHEAVLSQTYQIRLILNVYRLHLINLLYSSTNLDMHGVWKPFAFYPNWMLERQMLMKSFGYHLFLIQGNARALVA